MANVIREFQGITYPGYFFVRVPVASATAVEIGDMLKIDTNLGVVCTAATDNLTLHAIAVQAHAADADATTILCIKIQPGVMAKYPLNTSTAVAYGDNLQISGAQELTASDTDAVAVARETGTVTSVLCEFKQVVTDVGDAS